jgi:16S rRNA (uracil1498-N3)-methyltransferase
LIHDTKNFDDALKLTCDDDTFYGDPNAEDTKKFSLTKNSMSWFVGPEGGFSSGEITMMKNAGFKPLKLSPVIMRIESAALAGIIFLSNQFSTENTN